MAVMRRGASWSFAVWVPANDGAGTGAGRWRGAGTERSGTRCRPSGGS